MMRAAEGWSALHRRLRAGRWHTVMAAAIVTAIGASAGASALSAQDPPFPHEDHQGLFPVCTGCHTGIPLGDPDSSFPDPDSCLGCHNGTDYDLVAWSGPTPRISNLAFGHPAHIAGVAAAGEPALACASCHVQEGGERMAVVPIAAPGCLDCHGVAPDLHLTEADCTQCHVPLVESRLTPARVAALPSPSDHVGDSFLMGVHGTAVVDDPMDCATCHVREQCTDCHVDGGRAEFDLLPPGRAGLGAPALAARYPIPESHTPPSWESAHGREVPGAEDALNDCATCHTQDDCASCHLAPFSPSIQALRSLDETRAPGVAITVDIPGSHAWPYFAERHSTEAAADPASCAGCHTEPFCVSCHSAPTRPVFHPDDFMVRHSAASWSANTECASCHETRTFCLACHEQAGLGVTGRPGPGFHDAEPLFLLRHGQAARQSLESCASCHAQRDCVTCHSQAGGFRVNPHGPDFNPGRVADRNVAICFACHLSSPRGG